MAYVILVLILIVALLLGAVILVQNPKGGGLASGFESAGKIGGVQRTTDFLEKATWYLTVALFVLSMASSGFYGTGTSASGFSEDEFVAPVADPVAPATEQAPAQAPSTDPAPAN